MNDSPRRYYRPYYVSILLASAQLEKLVAGGTPIRSEEVAQTLCCLIYDAEALLSLIGKQEKSEKTPPS